ncbi:MAG: GNAT family N-acetyltransferase [Bacteroidales bacterium]|nr:GNAT family N-acetyltransferase [Bacteroidales bacterium]
MIVLAQNPDSAEIITLIDTIYKEYNDRVCLEDAESDLTDLSENYFNKGGIFWIYRELDIIVGTVAVVPDPKKQLVWLKRMYVKKEFRGTGIALELLKTCTQWTLQQEYKKIALWSDTRFESGHKFYKKHGFIKGEIREMFDSYVPYKEYYFEKIFTS